MKRNVLVFLGLTMASGIASGLVYDVGQHGGLSASLAFAAIGFLMAMMAVGMP